MKTYIFALDELVSYVEHELRPYLGVATHYCNHQALVASVLNDLLCELYGFPSGVGYCFVSQVDGHGEQTYNYADYGSEDILIDYSIPSEVRAELLGRLRQGILRMINAGMGQLDPQKEYQVLIDTDGDMQIQENIPAPPTDTRSAAERLRQEIREGIENGDWYPESIRRLVGY